MDKKLIEEGFEDIERVRPQQNVLVLTNIFP